MIRCYLLPYLFLLYLFLLYHRKGHTANTNPLRLRIFPVLCLQGLLPASGQDLPKLLFCGMIQTNRNIWEVRVLMKELNKVLNILMASFFGSFIGNLIANYRNYQQFQEIYDAANSAPWYYGSLSSLILFIAVVVVCVVIKLIIRNKTK